MVRTTATGSLKDAGQVVSLCCEAALVGGDGLGCGGFVGKGRDREKKEEESGGESFHDNLLGMEGSRAVGKRKGRPSLSGPDAFSSKTPAAAPFRADSLASACSRACAPSPCE